MSKLTNFIIQSSTLGLAVWFCLGSPHPFHAHAWNARAIVKGDAGSPAAATTNQPCRTRANRENVSSNRDGGAGEEVACSIAGEEAEEDDQLGWLLKRALLKEADQ